MSFSPELWVKRNETYLTPSSDIGLLLPTSQYINFGVLYGDAGYGIRDNSGTMQFKHNLGTWADLGSGGGFADPLTTNGDIIARIAGATTRLAQGGNGTFLGVSGGTLGYYTPSGTGDVVGPASAVNNRVAFFDGTTGKLIKDSGLTLSGSNTGDQTSIVGITGTKAQFDTAVTDGNFLYVGDITQYTDEQAQDAIGAMVDTSLTYVDGTPLLQRSALTGAITASAGSNTTALGSFTLAQLNTAVSDADVARTDAANTFTGVQTFSTPIASTSVATMTATVGGGVPTPPNNTTTFLRGDGTFAIPAGGSGITRIVVVTSGNVSAGSTASTDYVYIIAGAHTVTLPTAVGNTNLYTIKNNFTEDQAIATTSSQTVDGVTAPVIRVEQSINVISDGANWTII